MNDNPNLPDDQQKKKAPAPWERRPAPPDSSGSSLQQAMHGEGDEYPSSEEDQAAYLADDQQSLHSQISGGGRDKGREADSQVTRRCPACDRVTTFVQGVCTNCKHKLSDEEMAPPPLMDPANYAVADGGASPVLRTVLIIVVVLVVLGAAGYFGMQFINSGGGSGSETEPALAGETAPETFPGGLNAVTIDDVFHEDLTEALLAGNAAWGDAGVDCHVYPYSLYERLVAAEQQSIVITGFAGGDDVRDALVSPGDEPFKAELKDLFDATNARPGVEISITLRFTDGEETPGADDRYVRYGYYYGKEHWNDIGPIVSALEGARQQNGEYPHSLADNIVRPKIRTNGNMSFISDGFGFVPLFKTDGNGYIKMGSGSGLAELLRVHPGVQDQQQRQYHHGHGRRPRRAAPRGVHRLLPAGLHRRSENRPGHHGSRRHASLPREDLTVPLSAP